MNNNRITNPNNNIVRDYKSRTTEEGIFNTFDECIKSKLDLEKSSEKIVQVMKDHEKDRNEAEYQFYYTNDHLGSSTYITDQDGKITQTLAYLPYGEDWVDLDNQPPYLTPYKFNGKEKDQETGYQYFGARYLNPKLSIWLSVDPMSDKYPHLTSYNYCANNPVMLIDPDGKEIDPASDEQYVKPLEKEAQLRIESINAKMSKLNSGSKKYNNLQNQLNEYNDVLNEISSLRNDKNNLYTIKSGVEGLGKDVNGKVSYGGNSNGMNLINIDLASKADNPAFFLSTIAHELKHAFQFYNQEFGFILTDGIQTNSSMSKELEKKAFIRGDMFSGNTMINNNKFKMNHNLNFEKYSLPNTPNYNLMYDRTSVEEYNHAFGSSFLYNKNKK